MIMIYVTILTNRGSNRQLKQFREKMRSKNIGIPLPKFFRKRNQYYENLELIKPGVIVPVDSSSQESMKEYQYMDNPEFDLDNKKTNLHDYFREESCDTIFDDDFIRNMKNNPEKVVKSSQPKVKDSSSKKSKKRSSGIKFEEKRHKSRPIRRKKYEPMSEEDKPFHQDSKFENPDSSFDREKKISLKRKTKFLKNKVPIPINPEVPKLNLEKISQKKPKKMKMKVSLSSQNSVNNKASNKRSSKMQYFEKQASKDSQSKIPNDLNKINRMISIMDIGNSNTNNSKELSSKISEANSLEQVEHDPQRSTTPNRDIKSMKVTLEKKPKNRIEKVKEKENIQDSSQSNQSIAIDIISESSSIDTQRLRIEAQRRLTQGQDKSANLNLLKVKESLQPSSSSHMQGSHSFYSEIDFSRENLWKNKEEAQENERNNIGQISDKQLNPSQNNFSNCILVPTHQKNIQSVDDIPLRKNFTTFNELLNAQLKRNESKSKQNSPSPLNSPSRDTSVKSFMNAEDIDRYRMSKTNTRRHKASTFMPSGNNTPEVTYRDAILNLPNNNSRVEYQTPPLKDPSLASPLSKIHIEQNPLEDVPFGRLAPLDHQYSIPENPSGNIISNAEGQKYSVLLESSKTLLAQYKSENEALLKENDKLKYKLKKCKYLIKTQNLKILTLEEQVQRKDLENIKNQVEMEKRVLENTRMMTNGMLTQTEHFQSHYNTINKDQFEDRNLNYMSEAIDHTQYFTPKGKPHTRFIPRHTNSASRVNEFRNSQSPSPPVYISSKVSEISMNPSVTGYYKTGNKPSPDGTLKETKRHQFPDENVQAQTTTGEENPENQHNPFKSPELQLTNNQIDDFKSEQGSGSSEADYKIKDDYANLPEKYSGIQESSKQSFYKSSQGSEVHKSDSIKQSQGSRKDSKLTNEDLEFLANDMNDVMTSSKKKSGVITKFYTSGKIEKIYKDGTTLCTYKDGNILCTYQDGTREMVYPDGRIKRLPKKE
ncbi:unnamed protein product [Moneuplotes crassus]|uniref:Centromere protein J C-terminal domain-containing protein n=1 Tax=Euplotes crassus TaxID=5936 RepID=A0AAD1XV65_EUPCR|nr:unnamed protein product [Moneuplotes crassus]